MVTDLANLWSQMTDWLYAPFQQKQDLTNWALLIVMACVIAYGWKMILDNVLET